MAYAEGLFFSLMFCSRSRFSNNTRPNYLATVAQILPRHLQAWSESGADPESGNLLLPSGDTTCASVGASDGYKILNL